MQLPTRIPATPLRPILLRCSRASVLCLALPGFALAQNAQKPPAPQQGAEPGRQYLPSDAGSGSPADSTARPAPAAAPKPATEAAAQSPAPGAPNDPAPKSQINDDSQKLLDLALALKAEVDKTNKDVLSMGVIRKADEIEKFAHSVKERTRVSTGN